MANELVEKVARAIDPAIWKMIDHTEADAKASKVHADGVANERDKSLARAHAAIKAVAEWLDEQEGNPRNNKFGAATILLRMKLQETPHE
jgi:hypothetical protein